MSGRFFPWVVWFFCSGIVWAVVYFEDWPLAGHFVCKYYAPPNPLPPHPGLLIGGKFAPCRTVGNVWEHLGVSHRWGVSRLASGEPRPGCPHHAASYGSTVQHPARHGTAPRGQGLANPKLSWRNPRAAWVSGVTTRFLLSGLWGGADLPGAAGLQARHAQLLYEQDTLKARRTTESEKYKGGDPLTSHPPWSFCQSVCFLTNYSRDLQSGTMLSLCFSLSISFPPKPPVSSMTRDKVS